MPTGFFLGRPRYFFCWITLRFSVTHGSVRAKFHCTPLPRTHRLKLESSKLTISPYPVSALDLTRRNGVSMNWLRRSLFTPSSRSLRQVAASIVMAIAQQQGTKRKQDILDMLTRWEMFSSKEQSQTGHSLYLCNGLIKVGKKYLTAHTFSIFVSFSVSSTSFTWRVKAAENSSPLIKLWSRKTTGSFTWPSSPSCSSRSAASSTRNSPIWRYWKRRLFPRISLSDTRSRRSRVKHCHGWRWIWRMAFT